MRKTANKMLPYLFYGFAGLAVGGGVASAIYFLVIKPNEANEDKFNLGSPIIYDDFVSWAPDLVIKQYPYTIIDDKPEYFLSEDEMKMLMTRFVEETNFGPEIFNLKEISINNLLLFQNRNANGIYYPSTGQMSLQASYYDQGDGQGRFLSTWSSEAKVEKLFEVLYHEYGHHLFYNYVSSPFPNLNVEDYERYQSDSYTDFINTSFLDVFSEILNYDQSNETLDTPETEQIRPISEYRTLDELFKSANFDQPYEDNQTYYLGLPRPSNFTKLEQGYYWVVTKDTLDYLYSLDELMTRKYLLATMPFSNVAKEMINPNNNETDQHIFSPSLLGDYSTYATLFYNGFNVASLSSDQWAEELEKVKPGYNSNYLNAINYYDDDPFAIYDEETNKTGAQILAEEMNNRIGATNGDELSILMGKNSYRVTGENNISSHGRYDEGNSLRLGGYLNDTIMQLANNSTIYLSIKNEEDNTFSRLSPLSVVNKVNHYKEGVFNDETIPLSNSSEYFWITNDYIDASKFANQELYFTFANDNFPYKLKTYRGKEDPENGVTSSWLKYYYAYSSQLSNFKLWKADTSSDNGVIIKSMGDYQKSFY